MWRMQRTHRQNAGNDGVEDSNILSRGSCLAFDMIAQVMGGETPCGRRDYANESKKIEHDLLTHRFGNRQLTKRFMLFHI